MYPVFVYKQWTVISCHIQTALCSSLVFCFIPISNFLSASYHTMPAPRRSTKSVCKTCSKTVVTTPMKNKKTPSKLVVSAPKKSTGTGRKWYAASIIVIALISLTRGVANAKHSSTIPSALNDKIYQQYIMWTRGYIYS